MFTLLFWKAAFERGVKTFAQALAALLVGEGVGLLTIDWSGVLSVSGLAALVSVLTSIATGAVTNGSPSATDAEVLPGTGRHRAE